MPLFIPVFCIVVGGAVLLLFLIFLLVHGITELVDWGMAREERKHAARRLAAEEREWRIKKAVNTLRSTMSAEEIEQLTRPVERPLSREEMQEVLRRLRMETPSFNRNPFKIEEQR